MKPYNKKMAVFSLIGLLLFTQVFHVQANNLVPITIVSSSGQTFTQDFALTDSIRSIRAKIAQITGIPPDLQNLVFNGVQLDDDKTLGDYGITAGVTLSVLDYVYHTLTFLLDEGVRINPDRTEYVIDEGHDYTFYIYAAEGVADKQPYVTIDGEAVTVRPTQDGLGWVCRIPAVYGDGEIAVMMQDLVSNINPDEEIAVYSGVGELVIDTAKPVGVTIYTIAGQVVKQVLIENRGAISLPQGVYVVVAEGASVMAIVK